MATSSEPPRTMRALVQYSTAPYSMEIRHIPVPVPGRDEVLLKVKAVGTCGSDLHQFHGTQSWPVNTTVTLGHEFCGEIWEVGEDVTDWQRGNRVVSETAARVCGTCTLCRSGHYNLCPQRQGFGYGVDGACAEYVVVRSALLHHLPSAISWLEGAVTEPCCNAATASLVQSSVRPGDTVVILGPGPIGLLCTQMLWALAPTNLVVVGLAEDNVRLMLAYGFGATRCVDAGQENLEEILDELGDGLGAHLVIDASGSSATLKQALAIVRPGGQITKIGWGPQPVGFSLDPLVQKAVTLRGSFSHTYDTWERVLRLMVSGTINVRPLIREFDLEDWRDAFAAMDRREIAKAVLVP